MERGRGRVAASGYPVVTKRMRSACSVPGSKAVFPAPRGDAPIGNHIYDQCMIVRVIERHRSSIHVVPCGDVQDVPWA
jgi:transposase